MIGIHHTKWSAAKLAYTAEQRSRIMHMIRFTNNRESEALAGVSLHYPEVRQQIRDWYRQRWNYLLWEYERVLPHVDELP